MFPVVIELRADDLVAFAPLARGGARVRAKLSVVMFAPEGDLVDGRVEEARCCHPCPA